MALTHPARASAPALTQLPQSLLPMQQPRAWGGSRWSCSLRGKPRPHRDPRPLLQPHPLSGPAPHSSGPHTRTVSTIIPGLPPRAAPSGGSDGHSLSRELAGPGAGLHLPGSLRPPWSPEHPVRSWVGSRNRGSACSGPGHGWEVVTQRWGRALDSAESATAGREPQGECPPRLIPHSALLSRPPLHHHHPPLHPLPRRHLPARVRPEPLHHLSGQHQHGLRRLHQRHTLQK